MNYKITTKHLIIGMFVDYMLATNKYRELVVDKDSINMDALKEIMVKESEFSIYTPTNVLFLVIILGMLNNQISMFNYLSNISRDMESKYWVSIVSKALEIRAFGEENKSFNKSFYLFNVEEACIKYPEFSRLVHLYIKEELFDSYEGIHKMYPYFYYSSVNLEGNDKQLVTKWVSDYPIGDFYSNFKSHGGHTLETYDNRHTRLLSLPFNMDKDLSESTINFILYSLSFHFISIPLSSFEYLNNNYNV